MGAMKKMLMEGIDLLDHEELLLNHSGLSMECNMDLAVNEIFNQHSDFVGLDKDNEPEYLRWAGQIFTHWQQSQFDDIKGIRHIVYLTQDDLDIVKNNNFPAIPWEDDSTVEGALINGILRQLTDHSDRVLEDKDGNHSEA